MTENRGDIFFITQISTYQAGVLVLFRFPGMTHLWTLHRHFLTNQINEHVTSQWKLRKRRRREGIEQFIKPNTTFPFLFSFIFLTKMNSHKCIFVYNKKRDQVLTSLVSIEQMEPEASRGEEIETNIVVMVSLRCSKRRDPNGQWKPPLGKTTSLLSF